MTCHRKGLSSPLEALVEGPKGQKQILVDHHVVQWPSALAQPFECCCGRGASTSYCGQGARAYKRGADAYRWRVRAARHLPGACSAPEARRREGGEVSGGRCVNTYNVLYAQSAIGQQVAAGKLSSRGLYPYSRPWATCRCLRHTLAMHTLHTLARV